MNTTETDLIRQPYAAERKGFYHSTNIARTPSEVYGFFKDIHHIETVLNDFPKEVKNLFSLTLESSEENDGNSYEIKWSNLPQANITGNLSVSISLAPNKRGSIVSAIAHFSDSKSRDESPSTMMNYFLRRMKALCETGVLATTEGQPSGREELSESKEKIIH